LRTVFNMPPDKNPVFRKPVIPWYRSRAVYGFSIAFMLLVFMFGLAGISVAREHEQYYGYIWLPVLLVILSGGLIVSTGIRLIRRYIVK
jgi:hypothetical protein